MNSSILTPPTSHLYPLTNPWQLFTDLHIDYSLAADAGAGDDHAGVLLGDVANDGGFLSKWMLTHPSEQCFCHRLRLVPRMKG